ncbi:hypothetical protein [Paraburkholderia phenoliruptrix]|uniref:hypothetical protein n=1 Tax=Paraburkholderia phenoliruptrix TaxID=252970 RepID=UPI000AE289E8|nr:hypothetical protein [Paraburkholderia phenoliruptrix]
MNSAIRQLPDALRAAYRLAFACALQTVYLSAACLVLLAFALSWFLENHPLSPR